MKVLPMHAAKPGTALMTARASSTAPVNPNCPNLKIDDDFKKAIKGFFYLLMKNTNERYVLGGSIKNKMRRRFYYIIKMLYLYDKT